MRWSGDFEDLQDVFEENDFEIVNMRPTKEAQRFSIKNATFSLFDTGELLIQGRCQDYMHSITRRILKGDERFLDAK